MMGLSVARQVFADVTDDTIKHARRELAYDGLMPLSRSVEPISLVRWRVRRLALEAVLGYYPPGM